MSKIENKLLNSVETAVDESLAGFICQYPGLQLHGPHRFVTKVENHISSNVAVISGGGSGHEPFCTGYVGNGMLAGAVAGGIFTSPPKSHILQAIKYLNKYYKGGILVIVPNYTGDCLNFGMAVEHSKNINIKIETFIVGEDYASGQNSIAGKRGMCGLLFVYKLAGALASEGKSLEEIIETLHLLHKNMSTLGICSKSCSLPGQSPLFHVPVDRMELGIGVHGEAGIETIVISTAKEIVSVILKKLCSQLKLQNCATKVAVLINNLGTITELELNIICNEVFNQLAKICVVKRFYSGTLMSSLDMTGFQISILKFPENEENEWIRLLDNETDAPRWIGSKMSVSDKTHVETQIYEPILENNYSKFKLSEDEKIKFKKCLQFVSNGILENEVKLNKLDSGCGDGDCGTTLRHLAEGMQQLISTLNFECPADLLQQLSDIAETKMGGTSGGIYSLCFSSMAKHFINSQENSLALVWAKAFQSGIKTIMKYSRARKGDRTIIDALEPAEKELFDSIVIKNESLKCALDKAREAAVSGCNATKYMEARAGRASYVNKEQLTDVDAGAFGFVICITAISQCF
ncbi:triokinase/FMN cyclase-like [Arctopsyche grandis]|uniref:triokinase/FMN cyclase-like n=1 Tax=Arctopsyche grandis TaxID=121162 RepID=UPI00406D7D8D